MSNWFIHRLQSRKFQTRFLIVLAAVWHVTIASVVYEVGRHQLAPNQFYPNGIGKFAADGVAYAPQCVELCSIMKNEGPVAWLTWPTQLHLRLYSLPLMLFIRWTDFNILTIEPLNLIYFLGIIALVFSLGSAIFDRASGFAAAAIVGVWPSFVMHTTQLLRDPLLILTVLVLVWSIVEMLRAEVLTRRAVLLAFAASAAVAMIRIVRLPMWTLLCVIVGIAVALLVFRFIRRRQIDRAAFIFAVVLIVATAITPLLQPLFRDQQDVRRKRRIVPELVQNLPLDEQIARRRAGFQLHMDQDGNVSPADDGSRIDGNVTFNSVGDMIHYLPRAVAVGFLAPFPDMWFAAGKQVGSSGRWISGFEMLLTYIFEAFALAGVWFVRRKIEAWFLFSVSALGIVALGLVVSNVGALYRLRYPFWILIVILGTGGLVSLLRHNFFTRHGCSGS